MTLGSIVGAPGNLRASSSEAVSRIPGHLNCFYPTRGGSTGSVWWDETGTWAAPFTVSRFQSMVQVGVATVSRYSGHFHLFWITPSGEIGTSWWETTNPDNGGWGSAFTIAPSGNALPLTVTAVSRHPMRLDVFWVAPHGSVMTTWWDEPLTGPSWNAPFPIAGPCSAQGAVTAIAREAYHVDVFWTAPDGSIWTTWWQGGGNWNEPFAMTPAGVAALGSPLSASNQSPTHMDVF